MPPLQVNEVFADDATTQEPIQVSRQAAAPPQLPCLPSDELLGLPDSPPSHHSCSLLCVPAAPHHASRPGPPAPTPLAHVQLPRALLDACRPCSLHFG